MDLGAAAARGVQGLGQVDRRMQQASSRRSFHSPQLVCRCPPGFRLGCLVPYTLTPSPSIPRAALSRGQIANFRKPPMAAPTGATPPA
jgi:hypothetical protein